MWTDQLTICVTIISGTVFEVCRFRHKFRYGFEGRSAANVAEKDLLYPLRKENFLKLEITRFFRMEKSKTKNWK